MVKTWVVKHSGHKATYLRREPIQDTSTSNVLAVVKNGEVVTGEFMHIRRASREVGYVKVKHLKLQCGSSWRVQGENGAPTTLIRKSPQEAHDANNTVGYAANGELVNVEYLFVTRVGERRGGYIKMCHLRSPKGTTVANGGNTSVARAPASPPTDAQQWLVMDASHDGAWLRKAPQSDGGEQNIVCLVANGDTVTGEYVYVRRRTKAAGLAKFKDLEQQGGNCWRIHNNAKMDTTVLRREPREACDPSNTVALAREGETVEGEFVFVTRWDGKRSGYMKRRYLTALAPPQAKLRVQ